MSTTYSILSNSHEPSFNLAAEEYLLRSKTENYHYFYINEPSVIIGKHQNALAEINLPFLEQNNIPLFRRLSGGGTVFHDYGNLNFCFIKNGEYSDLVNFKKATEPIVKVLNAWGIPARNGERNDLLVDYKKVSGNACHVFKNRVMHHGTLLFDSNLETLTSCLKNDPFKFKDRAVKSVKSEVINLKEVFNKEWSATFFLKQLILQINAESANIVPYSFTLEDMKQIEELQLNKYRKKEWNYNYGPNYEFKKRSLISTYAFALQMQVEKGRMTGIILRTNHPDKEISTKIHESLEGKFHDKQQILNAMAEFRNRLQMSDNQLLSLFF
jgi:lipoate-protein ligase A